LTGRLRYNTKTFKGGKREAEKALSALVSNPGAEGESSAGTFGELIERWYQTASSSRNWSPKSVAETRGIINRYLGPLRPLRVDRIRTSDLDAFYDALRRRGGQNGRALASSSVRRIHAVVRAAFEQAVTWEWIVRNPAAKASAGHIEQANIKPPTPEQVLALFEAAEAESPSLAVFLMLAALTGARRGELCALRWSDLGDDGRITIERAISIGLDGPVEQRKPKTQSSKRKVALDTVSLAALAAHRQRCEERAEQCGVPLPKNSFVFSDDPDGATAWRPDSSSRMFRCVRAKVGLDDVRLHDLRHFVVTTLLSAGVDLPTVAGRVGHAGGGKTTLAVYAHFQQAPDRAAAELLRRILTPDPAAATAE